MNAGHLHRPVARPGKRFRHSGADRHVAALTLSGIPFLGPIGGARVGYIDGQYIINPTMEQTAESQLDLIVAVPPKAC